ncbi:dephospho-CoA kinase [Salinimicrobium oceani]|uniref:Dephospho-CoA kinase n=1 Tax=Salinimicrobium oceani TaxID=2722702 RepID=A0ABX1CT38_9FLAO|nr:dephospho-CoA kinase [Salinimicrobium oceani]NJW51456.1 dephospho-CoA kinase [Salinimicrobium oceani]
MKTLGLTGGIGSGKTTVANFFKELGVPVFIADLEARKIMEEDVEVQEKIKRLLGDEAYSNGHPNRKFIASQVFPDKNKLERLNDIIHPAVAQYFERWKHEQDAEYVVYEAAILFEKGGYKKCDFNLLITAPLSEKIKRVQMRDRSSPEEIEARMNHQWTDERKAELADFVIENLDLTRTRAAVLKLHETLLKSA